MLGGGPAEPEPVVSRCPSACWRDWTTCVRCGGGKQQPRACLCSWKMSWAPFAKCRARLRSSSGCAQFHSAVRWTDCLDSWLQSHVVLRHQGEASPFTDHEWLATRLKPSFRGGCRFTVAAFPYCSTPLVTQNTTSLPPTYSNSIFCFLSCSKTNQQHYRCY